MPSGRLEATAPSIQPSHRTDRRADLDFMRAFVVAGLLIFHSAVVSRGEPSWFVNDPQPSVGFTVFLLWGMIRVILGPCRSVQTAN
jgi:hypothetical protein